MSISLNKAEAAIIAGVSKMAQHTGVQALLWEVLYVTNYWEDHAKTLILFV